MVAVRLLTVAVESTDIQGKEAQMVHMAMA